VTDSEAKRHVSASGRLDSAEAPAAVANVVAAGDVLAGKFRVERILGSGGMGVVVEARHIDLDERVALKLLLPAALEQSDVVARFRREARAAVKIKSEHIARVIDVGSLDDGAPYIVMEYLEGYDLSKPIRQGARLAVPLAVDYILQAAEAIAEAHTMGIVHRDIKPPNLFLTHRADGSTCIKVLDFGISKVVGGLESAGDGETPEATLTHTSVVLGSPRYMAPEQISKPKTVDARADIWGIGATFYRMVTGHPPFEGNTLPEIFAAILMTPKGPVPMHERCPEIPAELDPIIRQCMRINPAERWQNVGDLAAALAPFGSPAANWSAERVRGILQSAGIPPSLPSAFVGSGSSSPASTSGAAMANTLETSAPTNALSSKQSPLLYVVAAVATALIAVMATIIVKDWSKPANVAPPAAPAASMGMPTPSITAPTVEPVAPVAVQAPTATASASAMAKPTAAPKSKSGPAKAKTDGDGDELFDQRN
jgi:eukaryotic-like serine/threonine-protein kinase